MGQKNSIPITSNFKVDHLYPGMVNKLSFEIKKKIITTITKKQLIQFQQLIQKHNISPNEGIWYKQNITTILHLASETNEQDILALLVNKILEQDPNPDVTLNLKNDKGETPVMVAVRNNAFKSLKILVETYLIDVHIQDNLGVSLLDILKNGNIFKNKKQYLDPILKGTPYSEHFKDHHSQVIIPAKIRQVYLEKEFNSEKLQDINPELKVFQILKNQIQQQKSFEDEEFIKKENALQGVLSENKRTFRKVQWVRIHTKLNVHSYEEVNSHKNANIFSVVQGDLRDCYFLVPLAAVTQYPDLFSKLINSPTATKYGVYSFNFYVMGKVFEVVVDDYLPVCKSSVLTAFAKMQNNEVWVPMIEKAWAKVAGGYSKINVGFTEEIWYLLTGAPGAFYKLSEMNMEGLWSNLLLWKKRNYFMAAVTYQEFKSNKDVLEAHHIYNLIDVVEVEQLKIVKLRNPWGYNINRGGDINGQKQLARAIGCNDRENGIIYVTLKERVL